MSAAERLRRAAVVASLLAHPCSGAPHPLAHKLPVVVALLLLGQFARRRELGAYAALKRRSSTVGLAVDALRREPLSCARRESRGRLSPHTSRSTYVEITARTVVTGRYGNVQICDMAMTKLRAAAT